MNSSRSNATDQDFKMITTIRNL